MYANGRIYKMNKFTVIFLNFDSIAAVDFKCRFLKANFKITSLQRLYQAKEVHARNQFILH